MKTDSASKPKKKPANSRRSAGCAPMPGSAVRAVRANAHLYATKKEWKEALEAAREKDSTDAKALGLMPLKPMFNRQNA